MMKINRMLCCCVGVWLPVCAVLTSAKLLRRFQEAELFLQQHSNGQEGIMKRSFTVTTLVKFLGKPPPHRRRQKSKSQWLIKLNLALHLSLFNSYTWTGEIVLASAEPNLQEVNPAWFLAFIISKFSLLHTPQIKIRFYAETFWSIVLKDNLGTAGSWHSGTVHPLL